MTVTAEESPQRWRIHMRKQKCGSTEECIDYHTEHFSFRGNGNIASFRINWKENGTYT